MYVKSVEITNYRIFYKNHYFNFDSNQNKSLNIIFGKNSTGKSSLIDAIRWCLYGNEIRENGIEQICNEEIVKNSARNEEFPVNVVMVFVNDFEQEIIVNRTVYFYKNENGRIIHSEDIFEITIDDVLCFPPKLYISKICSMDLFDLSYIGENGILFNPDFEKKFASIIDQYFQFNVIDKTGVHLDNAYNNFLNECKKVSSEISMLEKYDRMVKEHEEISQEIDNVNNDISKLNELREVHKAKINLDTVKRREELLKNLEYIDRKINKYEVDYNKLVLKSFPMVILAGDLCSKSEMINILSDFLSKESFTDFSHEIKYDLKYNLSDLKRGIISIPEGIKNIRNLKEERLEIVNEINLINDSLSNVDENWVKDLDSIEKRIDFSIHKLNALKRKKKSIESEILSLDKNIKEIQGLSMEFRKKEAFYKKAIDAIKLIREEFFKNVLNNISELMNNIFINDFCMSDKFSNVIIHENFEFDFVKNSGKHVHFSDLSYSERHIFYLSFMFSIQEIIGEDIFLIIDTQFLNFDGKHWSNFLSLLRNNSNQCFLLFNEAMYDEVTRVNLISNINVEYELVN